jgi:DNA-binding CsgD family transcriptional regulator
MGETTVNNIKLTRREMSILQEVAIGRTTPQIAQNLGLSPETVKWYRKRLLVKFSATTSAEVVRKAIMNNIL